MKKIEKITLAQINKEIDIEGAMYIAALRSTVKLLKHRARLARVKSLRTRRNQYALEDFADDLEKNFAAEFLNQLPNPDVFE